MSKVATAVCAVMKEVRRLQKADVNAFAKYNFTSVDDYKDFLRPLIAEHGLEVCMNQAGFARFDATDSKGKETTHCEFDFELWLKHGPSGEEGKIEATTVCLPYVGAQTTGQARSYAQKEWLKSKFLASSGDMNEDADSYADNITLSKADAREIFERLSEELGQLGMDGSGAQLSEWSGKNSILLDAMPDDWKVHLRQAFKEAQIEITKRNAASDEPASL